MKLFDVYPLFDVTIDHGKGCYVYDEKGQEYLDFYGGHAVISIGHCHPKYLATMQEQASKLSFYSNAVKNPLQVKLAEKLGKVSGYDDYQLFLINSGAEANENALKLASFYTGKKKVSPKLMFSSIENPRESICSIISSALFLRISIVSFFE